MRGTKKHSVPVSYEMMKKRHVSLDSSFEEAEFYFASIFDKKKPSSEQEEKMKMTMVRIRSHDM
eukprot:scaffold13016_cov154-Amphora_coffeaeformis.AAC.13